MRYLRERGVLRNVRADELHDSECVAVKFTVEFNEFSSQHRILVLRNWTDLADFRAKIAEAFGVPPLINTLASLVGKECFALRAFDDWKAEIEGFESGETGRRFLIARWLRDRDPQHRDALNALERLGAAVGEDIEDLNKQIRELNEQYRKATETFFDWEKAP